ncbi:MAG TPA: T9SS type A sorting domain-containing protein [Saprospiraceae bacterium]|nr:T9SS type A sorting domain-containing protein [Saprospiraceae bacterium]
MRRILFCITIYFVSIHLYSQCPSGSTALSDENFNDSPASIPSGWILTNGNTNDVITKTDYLLLEPTGGGVDIIQTPTFDVSGCVQVSLQFSVGTFGSASGNNNALVSFDFDTGTDPADVTTNTPTSSTYIDAFSSPLIIDIPSGTTSLTITIKNNGSTGRGVRFDNFLLCCITAPVCNISNLVVQSDGASNGDDAEYTVCADVSNGSGDYDLIDVNNSNAVISSLTGQSDGTICFMVSLIGPTTAETLSLNVWDNQDNSCIGASSVTVNIPDCPPPTGACPMIIGAMPNACGPSEGTNEFIVFTTLTTEPASAYNINYGTTDPPSNNNLNGADATTPNPGAGAGAVTATGCTLVEVSSPSTTIPSGSNVVFLPYNYDAVDGYDFGAFCLNGEVYVVYINTSSSTSNWQDSGTMKNSGSSTPRYLNITNSSLTNCDDTSVTSVSYIPDNLTQFEGSEDGAFVAWDSNGDATYVNNGCAEPSQVQPVELVFFKGRVNERGYAELSWQTASEVNNYGFEILSSNNLHNFRNIGFVHGHGDSNEIIDYKFIDDQFGLEGKYYRIKQLDYDGSFDFSKIVYLAKDQEYHLKFQDQKLMFYDVQKPIELWIHTLDGRLLLQNYITSDNTIDLNDESKGLYLVTLISDVRTVTYRIYLH